MARSYLPVDRDQPFLLPPDVRDWLAGDHLVWLVIDVVARVDTSVLHARHRRDGAGRRAYDPDMLLGLLIYAYCTGQRSSRQIERLCEVDVAYRVVCANHVPDHTTIARFRQAHEDVAVGLFADVLEMCAEAGLVKVGVVAIDGTKIGSDASLKQNRRRQRIEAEVAAMMADAERVDAVEDDLFGGRRGDELPDDLADPRLRKTRLDQAMAELKRREAARQAEADEATARAQARLDDEVAQAQQRRGDVVARAARAGHRPRGRAPSNGGAKVAHARARVAKVHAAGAAAVAQGCANDRLNITDIDSRVMPLKGAGWVQGYNAQAAVGETGVVVAVDVAQDVSDTGWCEPMIEATRTNLGNAGVHTGVGTMLFDAGYWTNTNGVVTDGPDGPDRLIATTKSHKQRQALRDQGPASGPPPKDATVAQAMEHRLRTPEGQALYAKRQHTVEPVFGNIKDARGFRRFTRRGLNAARAEWQLITATHNILKLHRTATT